MSYSKNKIICSKKNIMLTLDNDTRIHHIHFTIPSNHFDIQNYTNFTIYELLFELNKDVVESIEITKQYSENKADVLIIFKELGDTIKIPKNYMYITIYKHRNNDKNEVTFKSENNNNIDSIRHKISGCHRTICDYSLLTIKKEETTIIFNYAFKFDIAFQESNFIYNIIALLIKKVFYKLKLFIENTINTINDLQ